MNDVKNNRARLHKCGEWKESRYSKNGPRHKPGQMKINIFLVKRYLC